MQCEVYQKPEDCTTPQTWGEAWRALERLYAEGKVLSLGASNVDEAQMRELISDFSVIPCAHGGHAMLN